jgi:hypothetical protein
LVCLFLMRFLRVSGLAVCFLSLSSFPVRCVHAGFFRRGTLSMLFHLLSSFSASGFLPGSLWAPLGTLSRLIASFFTNSVLRQFIHSLCFSFIAVSTLEMGAVLYVIYAPFEPRLCAWVHLEPCFRGVIWNIGVLSWKRAVLMNFLLVKRSSICTLKFWTSVHGNTDCESGTIVNQCAQGVFKPGFRLLDPLW